MERPRAERPALVREPVPPYFFGPMIPSDSDTPIAHAPFTITADDREVLFCDVRCPAEGGPFPVVIFTHGFKGFKEWGSIPYICESLARRGFYTVSYNFSHNGTEGHGEEFTRLDRFAENTFSREVSELRRMVDAVVDGEPPSFQLADPARIGLVGHSRGGGITLLEAWQDERVRAVTVWAAVADFDRYTERQKNAWRRDGYMESKNMRTGQMMRLNLSLLEDLERNRPSLDIGKAAAELHKPLLILHGEQDLTVRIEDGERLAALADPALTEFVPIPGAAHTFGAVHPFEGTNPVLEYAIDRTVSFLGKFLGAGKG